MKLDDFFVLYVNKLYSNEETFHLTTTSDYIKTNNHIIVSINISDSILNSTPNTTATTATTLSTTIHKFRVFINKQLEYCKLQQPATIKQLNFSIYFLNPIDRTLPLIHPILELLSPFGGAIESLNINFIDNSKVEESNYDTTKNLVEPIFETVSNKFNQCSKLSL